MDEAFGDDWPYLHTFLTAIVGDDGKPRNTSVLTMFAEEGRWKGVLHERALGLCLWGTGSTFKEVLTDLEARLSSGSAEWRRDRGGRR